MIWRKNTRCFIKARYTVTSGAIARDSRAPRKAASAIGIIGGADGPTVIVSEYESGHTACSSMHFEPEYEPDWCMVFYKKPKEDIEIELI